MAREENRSDRCRDLVIVCCHAICENDQEWVGEHNWRLQPFQCSNAASSKPSEHETFVLHILTAAMSHLYRPETLVMFSGGRTSSESDKSEAGSYADVLENMQLSVNGKPLQCGSLALEERATDSYQNLVFSILRFKQVVGQYPRNVTVITHAFKERRFLELHTRAIKWPASRIRVQGINPPFTLEELEQTLRGEAERGYKAFAEDPYGVGPTLASKRVARNWDPRVVDELATGAEPEVDGLLRWQGGRGLQEIFPQKLPWENS